MKIKLIILLIIVFSIQKIGFTEMISTELQIDTALNQILELGINNNLTLQKARNNILKRMLEYKNFKSEHFPKIDFNSTAIRNSDIILNTNSNFSYTHSVNFKLPIYQKSKISNSIKISYYNYLNEKLDYEIERLALIFNIVNSLYELFKYEKLIENNYNSQHLSKINLNIAEEKFENSLVPKQDVLRWKLQLENLQSQYLNYQNLYEQYQTELFNFLNVKDYDIDIKKFDRTNFTDTIVYFPEKNIFNKINTVKHFNKLELKTIIKKIIRKQSPQFKVYSNYVEISKLNLKISEKDFLPTINFVHTSSLPQDEKFDNRNNINHSQMITFDFNIFNKTQTRNNIKIAEKSKTEKELNLKFLEAEILKNAEVVFYKILCLNEMIKSKERQLKLSMENYEIVNLKYRNGIVPNVDLIDAYTSLDNTKSELIINLFDLKIAIYRLSTILGSDNYINTLNLIKKIN